MATRSASGKILSFVFAAVAVAMVLESSTSVPGSKCLWNNVVSTLVWRVLNQPRGISDRKSTRLNSSHSQISYAVFCLKKKKKKKNQKINIINKNIYRIIR